MRHYECYIKPQPGEIIQTTVTLPTETAALISGRVLSQDDRPIDHALILLFQEDGALLQTTVTDEHGQFYLGPISPDALYRLRVQADSMHPRILELTV